MFSEITIRRGDIEDLAEIQRLNQQLFIYETEQRFHSGTYDYQWPYAKGGTDYFSGFLGASSEKILILAQADGKTLGYLAGSFAVHSYRLQNPIGEINNMFIEADFRHSGVGSKLFGQFKTWLNANKVAHVRVSTFTKNAAAISFYRSLGLNDDELILEMPLND